MKQVMITGAGGFIGRHLVDALVQKGVSITALMLEKEPVPERWPQSIKIVRGDVRKLVDLEQEIGEFDTIFHLAAIVSDWGGLQEHVDITVHGTEQAVELALKNNARFVVTTSVAAFGSSLGQGQLDENSPCGEPASNYEKVKQQQEKVTLDAVKQRGLDAAIIRPANVYGVGSVWVTRFLQSLALKKPILLGSGQWDAGLVHVDHVVQALILAGESQNLEPGDIFVIADGHGVTWQQYAQSLADTFDLPAPKGIPNAVAKVAAPLLEGIGHLIGQKSPPLVTHLTYRLVGQESIFISEKAKQKLGYQPSLTLEQAMVELKQKQTI